MKYRDDWIIWRNLGHTDSNGTWVAPISFIESQQLPAKMIKAFFILDDLVEKMAKQKANKGRK